MPTATKKTVKKTTKPIARRRPPVKTKPVQKASAITTTHNIFILDSSGSMQTVRDVTRQGFNEQVQTIKKLEKEGKLKQTATFYTFADNVTEKFANVPASQVNELQPNDYNPDGSTALNDCIGKAVAKARADLAGRTDTAVVLTILTDGQENASKEYNTPQIAALLKEVQEKEKWTVTYVGANQDVHLAARTYNLNLSNTVSYTSTGAGTTAAFQKMAKSRASYGNKLQSYAVRGMSAQCVDNSKFYNSAEAVTFVAEDGTESNGPQMFTAPDTTTYKTTQGLNGTWGQASDIHDAVKQTGSIGRRKK